MCIENTCRCTGNRDTVLCDIELVGFLIVMNHPDILTDVLLQVFRAGALREFIR